MYEIMGVQISMLNLEEKKIGRHLFLIYHERY